MNEIPACPSCQKNFCAALGPLKNVGGQLKLTEIGTLYDCPNCHLLFRHPYLSEEEIIAQYAALPGSLWDGSKGTRPDFDLASAFLAKHSPNGHILDVGCFRGDFLAQLPSHYEKWGIEPSEEAAAIARGQGITIVGKSLQEVLKANIQVDAIIAIDLIEHLHHPKEIIDFAGQILRPGGFLVVATGNANFWLWRRHRLDYWYNFTEHVSFFREDWFRWAAAQSTLKFFSATSFSHYKIPMRQKIGMARQTLMYEIAHSPHGIGRLLGSVYPFSRARNWYAPPSASWMKDHHLIVLQQP